MSKRKAEHVAGYFSQPGCEGLRKFVTSTTFNDLSGCDELARERLIESIKVSFSLELTIS